MKQSSITTSKLVIAIVLVAWDLIHYINEGISTFDYLILCMHISFNLQGKVKIYLTRYLRNTTLYYLQNGASQTREQSLAGSRAHEMGVEKKG